MDIRDFVTLTMLASGGEIQGKTMLQKLVYFVGVLTDSLDELGYRAHFYGPYSDRVANAVGQLKSAGVVDQNVSEWGFDCSGFEIKRYDYRLSSEGSSYAKRLAEKFGEESKNIEQAVMAYKKAGERDYMALSIAAKTYFMLGEHKGKACKSDLVKLAKRFGWTVSEEQVENAADYLQKLELVEIAPG